MAILPTNNLTAHLITQVEEIRCIILSCAFKLERRVSLL